MANTPSKLLLGREYLNTTIAAARGKPNIEEPTLKQRIRNSAVIIYCAAVVAGVGVGWRVHSAWSEKKPTPIDPIIIPPTPAPPPKLNWVIRELNTQRGNAKAWITEPKGANCAKTGELLAWSGRLLGLFEPYSEKLQTEMQGLREFQNHMLANLEQFRDDRVVPLKTLIPNLDAAADKLKAE